MSTTRTRRRGRSTASWRLLRKVLVRRRQELLDQMHDELTYSRNSAPGGEFHDVCDRAADSFYRELAHGLAENASVSLRLIDQAIERIDNGTYGLCDACGQPIPAARLRALPFADLCVSCKRAQEAEELSELSAVARPAPLAGN